MTGSLARAGDVILKSKFFGANSTRRPLSPHERCHSACPLGESNGAGVFRVPILSGPFDEESVKAMRFFFKKYKLLAFLMCDYPGFKAHI